MRRIAVPDIHGDIDSLIALEEVASACIESPFQWVFLGDMIDRGLFSAQVLKRLKSHTENGHVALRGNHEDLLDEMILHVGDDEITPRDLRFGLDNTLESFEEDFGKPIETGLDLRRYLKESGLGPWLKALPYQYHADGIAYTHAPVQKQWWDQEGGPSDEECCWPKPADLSRDALEFSMGAPEGEYACCGHVVMEANPVHQDARVPVRVSKGVYLDCGCGSREDGQLIAGVFEAGKLVGFLSLDGLIEPDAFG